MVYESMLHAGAEFCFFFHLKNGRFGRYVQDIWKDHFSKIPGGKK